MKLKYQTNQLNGEEIVVSKTIRDMCSALDTFIGENVADCREKSLALTKLEECAMWANKGVALNGTK